MNKNKCRCLTCGAFCEVLPSDKQPCSECGYNPKSKSKRVMTDGERSLIDYFERSLGFRIKLAIDGGYYDQD